MMPILFLNKQKKIKAKANGNGIIQDREYMRIYSGGVRAVENLQVTVMQDYFIGIVRNAEQNLNHAEMIKGRRCSMADIEKVIKALKCRAKAENRCSNPCERIGMCEYAKLVVGNDGEPYYPYICDKKRICEDALELLKELIERIEKYKDSLLEKSKTGKWIDHTYEDKYGGDGDIECPFCHKTWNIIDNCTETFDCCPGCGAKLSEK